MRFLRSTILCLSFSCGGFFLHAASPAEPTKTLLFEKPSGQVTPHEVQAFKDFMAEATFPKDNTHNAMVYGSGGAYVEALGLMYEITADPEILNRMITFTDDMLAARNNPKNGRVMWTGERDLVWPNKAADSPDATDSSTENGDVVGHIAYAAKLILKNKNLWAKKIGEDPNGFGATYLDRAKTYVQELDKTMDTYIVKWLVDPETHLYHFPTSKLYDKDSVKSPWGKPVPWNQQAMLNNAFLRLAECHELLNDSPQRVKAYDVVVKTSVDSFLSRVKHVTIAEHACYQWSYSSDDPTLHYPEDAAHGGYDIIGMYRAYLSGRYGVTADQMIPFANTVTYIMAQPGDKFAGRTNGELGKHPAGSLGGYWICLSEFKHDLFPQFVASNQERAKTTPLMTALLLWTRNRLESH